MAHQISQGFSEAERPIIAALYWEAFEAKLIKAMGPKSKALAFIVQNLNPAFGVVARDTNGTICGVAGFKTSEGALIGGGLGSLAQHYGWFSTLWRAPLLALLERDLASDVLLMDGICVDRTARGQGLGTALLNAIKDVARERGLASVRLDVINSNPRARALYERQGFAAGQVHALGPLKYLFGFDSSTEMVCRL